MKSPYSALLALRKVEEQQAEVALAGANHATATAERALADLRDGRDAWIASCLDRARDEGGLEGVAGIVARLDGVERAAEGRLEAARAVAETARLALIESRRQREGVEKLHLQVLAEAAREAARRAQAELDDLGGIGARARSEADAA